jgi:hypothetical protein
MSSCLTRTTHSMRASCEGNLVIRHGSIRSSVRSETYGTGILTNGSRSFSSTCSTRSRTDVELAAARQIVSQAVSGTRSIQASSLTRSVKQGTRIRFVLRALSVSYVAFQGYSRSARNTVLRPPAMHANTCQKACVQGRDQ